MRTLQQLIDLDDPGMVLVHEWVRNASRPCQLLPPGPQRDQVLLDTQVSTRSILGAIAYETGGILIDGGWLRFLGSGHVLLPRTLPSWNQGRSHGFFLVADDAVGGFFAINGGAFGDDVQQMYYWPPDSLEWEPLGFGFTDFFVWALSDKLAKFYTDLRWNSWQKDLEQLGGDSCFDFYPALWTKEGSLTTSHRRRVPIQEAYTFKINLLDQLSGSP